MSNCKDIDCIFLGVNMVLVDYPYKNRKDAECSYLLRQRDRPLEGNEKEK